MTLTDDARTLLVHLARQRREGAAHYQTVADLAAATGLGAAAIEAALPGISDWCQAQALPDLSAAVVGAENAGTMRMLPSAAMLDRLGGEARARAEADRVRDFDWAGWLAA